MSAPAVTLLGVRVVADERMPNDTLLLAPSWPPRPGDVAVARLPNGSIVTVTAKPEGA